MTTRIRDIILALIGLDERSGLAGELRGITRLQKLLFLLEREAGVAPESGGFGFTAYKAGPYSKRLYDDLELLENLGLISSSPSAESTIEEAVDLDGLSFDDLVVEDDVGPQGSSGIGPDSFAERRFQLTDCGVARVKALLANPEHEKVVKAIRVIKGRFSHYSLNDLLRYVYTRYPDMTSESEIIDKVMGRRTT